MDEQTDRQTDRQRYLDGQKDRYLAISQNLSTELEKQLLHTKVSCKMY